MASLTSTHSIVSRQACWQPWWVQTAVTEWTRQWDEHFPAIRCHFLFPCALNDFLKHDVIWNQKQYDKKHCYCRWTAQRAMSLKSRQVLHSCRNKLYKTALFPGTTQVSRNRKVKPIWILLKQETVSGSGISWAICKSAPCSRQITTHHSANAQQIKEMKLEHYGQPTCNKLCAVTCIDHRRCGQQGQLLMSLLIKWPTCSGTSPEFSTLIFGVLEISYNIV